MWKDVDGALIETAKPALIAHDPERAKHGIADIETAAERLGGEEGSALGDLLKNETAQKLIAGIFGDSPFLGRLMLRYPSRVPALFNETPSDNLSRIIDSVKEAALGDNRAAFMKALREAKSEAALLVALADLAGVWPLESVTGALTDFADCCVQAGVHFLLREAVKRGQILRASDEPLEEGSGLVILGMGKYGSGELNYSSDIDLVVFYEPDQLPLKDGLDHGEFFVRVTRDLVKLLQERTEDGYVFRTDLRLRPDPGGTPVAVSLPAAESYYESRGQNWERAAFIKARPVAGDMEAGARFLKFIEPYIWRRNLDFAAIADIHSMKRQIHVVGGHEAIAVAGHNIKLGRGGIREIEFFVQTQQLIAGGREHALRGKKTVEMLDELARQQWIEPNTAEELKRAYRFLRTLEHRVQMVADEQTHTLPSNDEGIAQLAAFMGYESAGDFAADVTKTLGTVQGHYALLFETAPPLAEESGSLVFTGTDDDPDTLETLQSMGFTHASQMSEAIRAWHSGRFPATRTARSRELLTDLMPALLRALSRTASPDTAFSRFDKFMRGLPAGVQLFSMLYSNPHLLDLLAGICGTAPKLANYLSQNPRVLEAVIDPDFFKVLPGREELRESLKSQLVHAVDYQDMLDFSRVWAREYRFRLGVRVLTGSADAEEAGPAYAALAGELIEALAPAAEAKVAERHGRIPGGRFCVLGMGKLGGSEMSASSDLDLIVLYDVPSPDVESDGAKPLYASQYYARICQQLISALTAPTAEGKLYEVDMRLRPSGNAGPIATPLDAFRTYQTKEAWTWEHMALTRARPIAGPADLMADVEACIREILTMPRDRLKTAVDVADMRNRIAKEFPDRNPWEMKHVRGGLIDIEFIAQYLQLLHGAEHPEVLNTHTRTSLEAVAAARLLPTAQVDELIAGLELNHNLTQAIRVCVEGVFKPAEASRGLKTLLLRAGNAPSFEALESQLAESQARVLTAFEEIVGTAR
ncbi:bifunctional [glutamine synthetase] adenylyltransferase/[glutamine synthetase]-adenylyl-L-tyrosine phosphorylase [Parvibaculum sp.]|uniref:bifunctional [glutamine synthetase] adenylyltransferase/[glutamine synthetase]-adenylyl-L-tyrosine phosphorylase n=1 Tax=Parvibaculum sp. TaxID=2024848 RepID=UPI000C8B06DD|nr:bifunctional [glutamine synthetase] adenylyltransferase/[glutamine synthetase]-adenylyl-L-tyrosine phosphorylase [Parvibaculum sp.]MAB13246.1 bifunctional [glutamate--ammonia ligase]-adenylyl-L-tyrosine phosphorylase/[glutamate--ammonia-ligase] adenylyltransferase [Parvibaculum sp.]